MIMCFYNAFVFIGVSCRTLPHNDSQVNALSISPDGQLLAACGYQHIKMFDVQGTNANPVVNYEGVQKNVMSVGFQEEARWMYTGGEDGTAKIWDLRMRNLNCSRVYATGQQQSVGGAPPTSGNANNLSPVNSLRLHPNQQDLIIGDQNGNVHIWDIRQKPEHATVFCPQSGASIQSVSIDPQGKIGR
jgi:G protein beta subunit-like protein